MDPEILEINPLEIRLRTHHMKGELRKAIEVFEDETGLMIGSIQIKRVPGTCSLGEIQIRVELPTTTTKAYDGKTEPAFRRVE